MDAPLVIVTGGSSGIGAVVVALLAKRGARPVGIDIAPARGGLDGPGLPWPASVDVSDEEAVETAVAAIEEKHGAASGLVNAAGVLGKMHRPERLRMADWDREMAVDLRGVYLMCRTAGSRMAGRGQGAIVNIASVAGMSSGPLHGYGPAKAGVLSLTATLAAEWGLDGVRVNAVSPGFTHTPALEAGFSAGALRKEDLTRTAALGRLVEPVEVANAVAWLLSPEASGITGANIPVDAGFLAGVPWQAYGGLRRFET